MAALGGDDLAVCVPCGYDRLQVVTQHSHVGRDTSGRLRSFLKHPSRPAGTLVDYELDGFLFAVACAPVLIRPSEWLPIVFGETTPTFESLGEAEAVTAELIAHYNSINTAVDEACPALPPGCELQEDLLANLHEAAPISQWSRGFLRGHDWLEEPWAAYVPEALDTTFATMLLTLTFFASTSLAQAYVEELGAASLAVVAARMRRAVPVALAEYAALGRTIQRVLTTESGPGAPIRAAKIGRNASCPCGSGRRIPRVAERVEGLTPRHCRGPSATGLVA